VCVCLRCLAAKTAITTPFEVVRVVQQQNNVRRYGLLRIRMDVFKVGLLSRFEAAV
jgi:hypothetical protein